MSSQIIRATEEADGLTIARFDNYAEAQRALDALADRDLAVDRVAIVRGGLIGDGTEQPIAEQATRGSCP